jgi:hypothetical protein
VLSFTPNEILVENYYPGSDHYVVTASFCRAFTLIEVTYFKTEQSFITSIIKVTG